MGSDAVVRSNNHLTQLLKMTFRKKSPESISLFFVRGTFDDDGDVEEELLRGESDENGNSGIKTDAEIEIELGEVVRKYRLSRRKDFVDALQKNMARFK